ncbi:anti-sigma factor [Nocardia jejuensis]|uniref:anti-sigma factor n=1 Tax=Nocardia jejuensis TaxID=328049 RepID=UPI001FE1B860|nr:anti-sigma factor [Nocardia jejuensis]
MVQVMAGGEGREPVEKADDGSSSARRDTEPGVAVGIRVPAELDQLLMLRSLAETVALIADFTLDAVTDIRVVLDEVATALMLAVAPDAVIDCDFRYDDEAMTVTVRSVSRTEDAFRGNDFGWQLALTLADFLEASTAPFDSALGGYPVLVSFRRVRSHVDGS